MYRPAHTCSAVSPDSSPTRRRRKNYLQCSISLRKRSQIFPLDVCRSGMLGVGNLGTGSRSWSLITASAVDDSTGAPSPSTSATPPPSHARCRARRVPRTCKGSNSWSDSQRQPLSSASSRRRGFTDRPRASDGRTPVRKIPKV